MIQPAPPGWRVRVHDELPSTQDAAVAAARAGEQGGLAVIARAQSAGRGTGGRNWVSTAGNLHMSVLIHPRGDDWKGGIWALLAGVALYDAVRGLAPDAAPLSLKWPNDLLLGSGKLGGVLIETSLAATGGLEWLVAGFGVNVAHAPPVDGRQVVCLADRAAGATADDLAIALLAELDRWIPQGSEAIRSAWLARAHPVGTKLRVRVGGHYQDGVFDGLFETGALRLAGHERPILAGEVSRLPARPASARMEQHSGRSS